MSQEALFLVGTFLTFGFCFWRIPDTLGGWLIEFAHLAGLGMIACLAVAIFFLLRSNWHLVWFGLEATFAMTLACGLAFGLAAMSGAMARWQRQRRCR